MHTWIKLGDGDRWHVATESGTRGGSGWFAKVACGLSGAWDAVSLDQLPSNSMACPVCLAVLNPPPTSAPKSSKRKKKK